MSRAVGSVFYFVFSRYTNILMTLGFWPNDSIVHVFFGGAFKLSDYSLVGYRKMSPVPPPGIHGKVKGSKSQEYGFTVRLGRVDRPFHRVLEAEENPYSRPPTAGRAESSCQT